VRHGERGFAEETLFPERKRPALRGPAGIDGALFLPEDAVAAGAFAEAESQFHATNAASGELVAGKVEVSSHARDFVEAHPDESGVSATALSAALALEADARGEPDFTGFGFRIHEILPRRAGDGVIREAAPGPGIP